MSGETDPPSDPEREVTSRTYLREVATGARTPANRADCVKRDKAMAAALDKLLSAHEREQGSRTVWRTIGGVVLAAALAIAGAALARAEAIAVLSARFDEMDRRLDRIETLLDNRLGGHASAE